ncbi:MAG: ABC transporter permease [Planctomycetes bacterium]|nr:ABC transporter permease [Planctomycetota bacterium]
MTQPPVIQLSGVARTYDMGGGNVVQALRGIDLTIRAGEFVAIVGPSGSGKTTLMYLLGCLDQPDGGSYRLCGEEIAHLDDLALSRIRNRRIGYVFQQYNLLAEIDVVDNIALGLVYAGEPPAQRRETGVRLATRLGLEHRLDHTPRELSGGQMQRVAIARGLACGPQIILADEPTGNLDSKTGAEIMSVLRDLHAQGSTVVLVTHDPTIASQAHRVVRIVDGSIVSDEVGQGSGVGGRGSAGEETAGQGTGVGGQWQVPHPPDAGGSTHASDPRPLDGGGQGPDAAQATGDSAGAPRRAFAESPAPGPSGIGWRDLLRIALSEGILAHKLRSFLTMLGIVFGVAAVIAMTAITEGGKRRQLEQIRQIGLNNVQVRSVDLEGARLLRERRVNPAGLTTDDLAAVREHVPGIAAATAWKGIKAEIRRGDKVYDRANTLGVHGDFQQVVNFHVGSGRFLDQRDDQRRARVCVLGGAVAEGLGLGAADAIGATIVVGDEPFTVVGVMGGKQFGESDIADAAITDRNRDVYLPYASLRAYFRKALRESPLDAISLRMDSDARLLTQSQEIRRIVADLHDGAEDFVVAVPLESLKQAQRTKEVFNVIIVVIAAISLVVGGIGIMNIMLATVTERTREIGIRRAIGASRRDILRQFLAESLLISSFGGLIGLALGIGGGLLVQLGFAFPVAFSGWIMLLATGTSMGVGVVFGIYPAWLAAQMNPVDALRN